MTTKYYKRSAVPPGGKLRLQVQFRDVGGRAQDTDSYPNVTILTATGTEVFNSNVGIRRLSEGHYGYELTVPDGYADGVWRDVWTATIDGYASIASFDFSVSSVSTVEAIGDTVSNPEMKIGDSPNIHWSQEEIFGINVLMEQLRYRLRNTQIKPNGQRCDILSIGDMQAFLWLALSEFNATPAFTGYLFSDPTIYTIFSDIIVEGAYLKALPSIIPAETGREWVVTDDGISVTPASVSNALSGIMGQLYTEYRAKLKEAKRNHRAAPIGMGAGQLAVANPAYRRIRNLKLHGQF